MMNGLALLLVIFSLAGAGVWSPPGATPGAVAGEDGGRERAFREGHRMIIVEYERETPDRRRRPPHESLSAAVEEVKEKLAEAVSVMPNLGQGISSPLAEDETLKEKEEPKPSPKEKICDAYGVCKEKVSKLLEKSKSKAAEVEEKAKHAEQEAMEKAKEIGKNFTEIFRRAKDAIYKAATAAETAAGAAAVAHLVGFATAYGTCVWVSFVSSQVLAGAVSRHQFGILQSKLYPVYFRAMAYSVGLAALTASQSSHRNLLLLSLALILGNLFFLEPKATKVMFEKMKLEKEEGRGRDMAEVETETTTSTARTAAATPTTATFGVTKTTVTQETLTENEALKKKIGKLQAKLRALNGYSSFINVLSLMTLSWHLVVLARRMQGSCEPVGAR